MEKFDYLVVGSGLYGAIFAHEAKAHGKSVLVVDKRPNIAGNIYTENVEGINVHKYGAHIFHTNNKNVWNYITQFAEFNRFTNSPVANYKCKHCKPVIFHRFYTIKDGVVFVHVITLGSDGRARGRIAHFDGAAGFLVHPVQIGLGVRNFRLNLKNVCTDSIGKIFSNLCGNAAGGEVSNKSFAHDKCTSFD